MKIAELFRRALFYVSVPKCVCCKEPLELNDEALCAKCRAEYDNYKSRNCSRCAKPYYRCSCSNFYLESHYIKRLIKVYRYDKHRQDLPGNYLVYSLKRDNRKDTLDFLTRELTDAINASREVLGKTDKIIVTNVPRRRGAIIEAGYDHAAVLAKRVAKALNFEYRQFLVSRSRRAQKSMTMSERAENARFSYRMKKPESIKGYTVILVDDVVTSGNSMSKCAKLLRGLGAKRIVGATVSIAYKDSYEKPDIFLKR